MSGALNQKTNMQKPINSQKIRIKRKNFSTIKRELSFTCKYVEGKNIVSSNLSLMDSRPRQETQVNSFSNPLLVRMAKKWASMLKDELF